MSEIVRPGGESPDENLPNPAPKGLARVAKTSPLGVIAIAEFNNGVGWDIREVMRDEWWEVGIATDGHPDILLTADGVRAMARFAPRPDAPEIAEQVIAKGRGQR